MGSIMVLGGNSIEIFFFLSFGLKNGLSDPHSKTQVMFKLRLYQKKIY